MGDLVKRKMEFLQAVANIQSETEFHVLEKALHAIERKKSKLRAMARPTQKKLDIEKLKRSQRWKPRNQAQVMESIKKVDVQEPIELLLSQLSQ